MIYANTQANKVALVTGSARRIGAAIVQQLHQADFKVIIHCNQSLSEAKILAKLLNHLRPNSAQVLQANLENKQECEQLIANAVDWGGQLDLLINNASLFKRTDLKDNNSEDWQQLFAVNVQAPFILSLASFPHLLVQQGAIINITDIHAEKPLRHYAAYCQTKAALVMQTKALAKEFAPSVRVNAIAPGAIIWPENENLLNSKAQEQIIEETLLKRHGDPKYIAQALLALVDNGFITGQILNVDGGRSIH